MLRTFDPRKGCSPVRSRCFGFAKKLWRLFRSLTLGKSSRIRWLLVAVWIFLENLVVPTQIAGRNRRRFFFDGHGIILIRIVLDDHFAYLAEDDKDWNDHKAITDLLSADIQVLFHLRQMGAEDLVSFRFKTVACQKHWKHHALEAGFHNISDLVKELTTRIALDADIEWLPQSKTLSYRLYHPLLDRPQWGAIAIEDRNSTNEASLRKKAARQQVILYLSYLSADVFAARQFQAPLGSTVTFYREVLQSPHQVSTAEVAFELRPADIRRYFCIEPHCLSSGRSRSF